VSRCRRFGVYPAGLIGGGYGESDADSIQLSVRAAVANCAVRRKSLTIDADRRAGGNSFLGFDTDARFGDIEQGSPNILSSIDAQVHSASRSNANLFAVLGRHRIAYRTFPQEL
jgi:hypothetical protein